MLLRLLSIPHILTNESTLHTRNLPIGLEIASLLQLGPGRAKAQEGKCRSQNVTACIARGTRVGTVECAGYAKRPPHYLERPLSESGISATETISTEKNQYRPSSRRTTMMTTIAPMMYRIEYMSVAPYTLRAPCACPLPVAPRTGPVAEARPQSPQSRQ